MSHPPWYLAISLVLLFLSFPLLLRLVRLLSAPWRTVAERYPGPGPAGSTQVSYVMARFRGRRVPFSVTRSIRVRATDDLLCLTVLGVDFLPAQLSEIVLPRHAIVGCTARDFIISRQEIRLADPPARIVLYGKGARFVRAWWDANSGG